MQIFNLKIYNNTLDPLLWDANGNINPKISNILLKIANDFYSVLKIPAKIIDIILVGSSAGYNWSEKSDIDVHVVIDYKELNMDSYEGKNFIDLSFNAMKSQWNSKHKIHIRNKLVEVYVQDVQELLDTHSAGMYSLLKGKWLKRPVRENVVVDEVAIKSEFRKYAEKVNKVLTSNCSPAVIESMINEIYAMRERGLGVDGEMSQENIVFKLLRNKGFLDALKKAQTVTYDKQMSVDELVTESISNIDIKREVPNNSIYDRVIKFNAYVNGEHVGKITAAKALAPDYYTIIAFQIFNTSLRGMGIGKKLMNAVLTDPLISKKPILVKPQPYNDDEVTVDELRNMYKHFGFHDWEIERGYMIYDKH